MKHLNVTRTDVRHLVIDFDVNRFVAYAVVASSNGEALTAIQFAAAYSMAELEANDEFAKYADEWRKPGRMTTIAIRKACEEAQR